MKWLFENISKTIRAKAKKWMKSTHESTYPPCTSPFLAKNVIKGEIEKIEKMGIFKKFLNTFDFFEKKVYSISYFDPLVI